jgi:hypothetical protein
MGNSWLFYNVLQRNDEVVEVINTALNKRQYVLDLNAEYETQLLDAPNEVRKFGQSM